MLIVNQLWSNRITHIRCLKCEDVKMPKNWNGKKLTWDKNNGIFYSSSSSSSSWKDNLLFAGSGRFFDFDFSFDLLVCPSSDFSPGFSSDFSPDFSVPWARFDLKITRRFKSAGLSFSSGNEKKGKKSWWIPASKVPPPFWAFLFPFRTN